MLIHMKHNTPKHLLPRAKFVKYDANTWELAVDGCPKVGDWVAATRKNGRVIRFEVTHVRITHRTRARTFSYCRFQRPESLK